MNQRGQIEKLKEPELAQPLGFYDEYHPELAAIMREAGPDNCLYYQWGIPAWIGTGTFVKSFVYILKKEYEPKPEPEYIEIEIVLFNGSYRLKEQSPNNRGKKLCNVISDQGFVCFHDDFSMETTNAGDVPGWMRQLAAQDGIFKVHARFIKGMNP